jgi:hypothetical protein
MNAAMHDPRAPSDVKHYPFAEPGSTLQFISDEVTEMLKPLPAYFRRKVLNRQRETITDKILLALHSDPKWRQVDDQGDPECLNNASGDIKYRSTQTDVPFENVGSYG